MLARTQATEHTEEEKSGTLMPIAQILQESNRFDDAAEVLREWCGVSDASAALDAFCALLEACPAGLASLEFSMDTKKHWRREKKNWTIAAFNRLIALATEDHRRSAVRRINFEGHKLFHGARDRPHASTHKEL